MGGGSYSTTSRSARATDSGYFTKSSTEIFASRNINSEMTPYNLSTRESRDSAEHPNSVAIIVALDVTGSMGSIPHQLVKHGLPTMMQGILDAGIPDPQVLFLGIGDHECDISPLQVGQFESSDELLDHWLTKVYLEGGGGGNDGESYMLAWYLAAMHTSIDCFEKRNQKGILFTIGDEPVLSSLPARTLKNLIGEGQHSNVTSAELLAQASKTYEVFHIHVAETRSGGRQRVIDNWKQLLGDGVLIAQRQTDIPEIIATKVAELCTIPDQKQENTPQEAQQEPSNTTPNKETMLL